VSLLEILEGCFSGVIGKGSVFWCWSVFFGLLHSNAPLGITTLLKWIHLMMDFSSSGFNCFYNIRKPLHFEDRDLKNRRSDFYTLGPFFYLFCVSLSLLIDLGDPQSFPAHNGPLSSLPQVSASLSHVTINGDSLISGVKGASRMGGFFLSAGKEAIGLSNNL